MADSSQPRAYDELTGPDGSVHYVHLPPGDYWIKAEYLSIAARYECFHINPSPSRKARKSRQYEWGEMPIGVREAAGCLVNLQSKGNATPLDKVIHRIEVPITGAKLELRRPLSHAAYESVSDSTGNFRFDDAPPGIYVLHVAADPTSNEFLFDSADFLIAIGKHARMRALRIVGGAVIGSQTTLSLDLNPGKI